ncbi:MAG TPA: hypothetical protein VNL69_08145, partial [Bacteroidota bacterium]|nr:hypothetical protein [Bacteroidota bacterium]
MKRHLALLWTIPAMVGMLVVGCNKNTNGPEEDIAPPGVTDERSAIVYQAVNDEFVKNDEETFADQEVQPTDYGLLGKVNAEIIPLRWGRFITSVTRTVTVTIEPGDTIAIAHVHKIINGVLKIRAINTNGDTILVEKPFSDESDRNVVFRRVLRGPRFWRNWIPVATSLVAGGTPNGDISITQLQFITRRDTLTITDPLNFYLRYRWLRSLYGNRDLFHRDRDVVELNSRDSVTVRVTLTSTSPDTDLVALRFGFNSFFKSRAKMFLVSQNGNVKVYERTFYVHPRPGHFHAAVEA